jgi:hypothetical protein
LAQAKEAIPVFHVAQAGQRETSRDFPFPYIRINGQVEPTRTDSSPSTAKIAFPIISVPNFDTTIVKRPFKMRVYDSGGQDGDVIRILLNGTFVKDVTLKSAGEIVELQDVRARVNRIEIIALSEGSSPPLTLGMSYAADQVVQKQTFARTKDLTLGETFSTTVGFPQIALCLTVPRFPCTLVRAHFESATHVLESLGIPPEPITAPLKPGRTGNTLRPYYPRLLTLDRPGGIRRRQISTKDYQCPAGANQDRDEYPPAAVLENRGSAHIKCIDSSDNQGAGSSISKQWNNYKITEDGPIQPRLDDGDTIEFVVLL